MHRLEMRVVREFSFEAAHYLPGYDGKCKNTHGHSYRLQVGVTGRIDRQGMVIDFKELDEFVDQKIIEHLDHTVLNDVNLGDFPRHMPTAENMVVFVRDVLTTCLQTLNLTVTLVRLWETQNSWAEWEA